MKTLKYLSFLLLSLVLGVGFTSCSDDDDHKIEPSAIIGEWELVWDEGYEHDAGYNDRWSEEVNGEYWTFKEDGKGYYAKNEKYKFSWRLDENKFFITDGYDTEEYTVVKLVAHEMIIEEFEKDGSYEYYSKTTLKKVE